MKFGLLVRCYYNKYSVHELIKKKNFFDASGETFAFRLLKIIW